MRRMDGMRAAERIRELDTNVILVFVTQMVNFAVQGYAVNAMDFLIKPISYPSMERVLRKAVALCKKHTQYITVPTSKGLLRLDAQKIYYLRLPIASSFMPKKAKYHYERPSVKWRDLWPPRFFRCNNCYLVNRLRGKRRIGTVVVWAISSYQRPRRAAFMALTNYLGGIKV